MKLGNWFYACAGVSALFVCISISPAKAVSNQLDWAVDTTVVGIDDTAAPRIVAFQISKDAGNCPAGHWLVFSPGDSDTASQSANAQALINLLQTANGSGATVTISGFDAGCLVQAISLAQ